MKKKLLSVFVLTWVLCQAHAQSEAASMQAPSIKIGHINIAYVTSRLPETRRGESELRSYETQLRNQIEAVAQEFRQKLQAFEQDYETMPHEVRAQKHKEVQLLENRLKQLQQEAQGKLVNKQASLLAPIQEKVQQAIQQVAQDQGYTHIFNSSLNGMPILLYASEEYDISETVLQRLGINTESKEK